MGDGRGTHAGARWRQPAAASPAGRAAACGLLAILVLLASCGRRLDLPPEPETEATGEIAYQVKYDPPWQDLPVIADLVLTHGRKLFGVADTSRVVSWFSDMPAPDENEQQSIPAAVLDGDTLRGPIRICEGTERTLWVAYRRPTPALVQWNIGGAEPTQVDSGVVRLAARFGAFGAIAADDDSGFVYVADADSNRIVKYAPSRTGGGQVAVLAGAGTGDYYVQQPQGLFWFADSLLVADTGNDAIKVVSADTPFAGRGLVTGPAGDLLQLAGPLDVWVDDAGFFYVADTGNSRVLKLTPQGKVKEVVTEFDRNAALAPAALAATNEQVWVVDPERRRLTIYRINTGEELP